jgi:ribosome biogenesis protein BMS1
MYGYVRGTHLKPNHKVHMIGVGDYDIKELSAVDDPCCNNSTLKSKKDDKKMLNKKKTLLYAPYANVGAVTFDNDAIYIDIGNRVNYTKKDHFVKERGEEDKQDDSSDDDEVFDKSEPAGMLRSLQDIDTGIDQKMMQSSGEFRFFKNSKGSGGENGYSAEEDEQMRVNSEQEQNNANQSENSSDEEPNLDEEEDDEASLSDAEDDDDDSDDFENEEDDGSDYSESDDDDDDDDEGANHSGDAFSWKVNLAQRAATAYLGRLAAQETNLQELIYGSNSLDLKEAKNSNKNLTTAANKNNDRDNDSDDDELFKVVKKRSADRQPSNDGSQTDDVEPLSLLSEEDTSRVNINSRFLDVAMGEEGEHSGSSRGRQYSLTSIWLQEGEDCLIESIRDKFVTGNWDNKNEKNFIEEDEAVDGDFEDLETGERFGVPDVDEALQPDDFEGEGATAPEGMNDEELREWNAQRKMKKKSEFDKEYDQDKKSGHEEGIKGDEKAEHEYLEALRRQKEEQLQRNRDEFGDEGEAQRLRHEGFYSGLYVRIVLERVPRDFVDMFDPTNPLILGGLTPQETIMGLIRCRFKKHRWHKKILKCNDPLVFSVGWRRFQSVPVFSMEDTNGRHRYLKYTPEHMHCHATFYGYHAPPNTGVSLYINSCFTSADFILMFLICIAFFFCFVSGKDLGNSKSIW